MATKGSNPPEYGMKKEVARVPKTRIGAGAKPGPNDGTRGVATVPKRSGSGAKPKAMALEKEVNPVKKGRNGGSAKSVGGWNSRRAGKKK
jgi:hypothetical protein